MPQAYRVFLGRKTLGAPHWRVEFNGGAVDTPKVVIAGVCTTHYLEGHHYPFSMSGTGIIDVQADQVSIFDSRLPAE